MNEPNGLPGDLPPALDSLQGDESPITNASDDATLKPTGNGLFVGGIGGLPELPGYRVEKKLGQGGMGAVFLAIDEQLHRPVAIKMVTQTFRDGEQIRGRFDAEIKTLAGLQHTHIAQLYSTGEYKGFPFFVMEFVDGKTLEEASSKPLASADVVRIMIDLCDAVHFCHEREILHRDLKPANVLMTKAGKPKIADFGLAKIIGQDSTMTKTGEILGTPSYMAPEQASGVVKSIGPTCDVYGLGAIMYRLLTGRPPFVTDDPFQTVLQVLANDPVSPRKLNSNVSRDLETICLKCLEKKPARRYASAKLMQDDLRRFLDGRTLVARPAGWMEKSWKWAVRNKAASIALLATGLAIVATVAGLTWHNRLLANELARSRRLAEHGSELSNWLVSDHMNDLALISGTANSRHHVLDRVNEYLNASFSDMPQESKYTRRLGFSYSNLADVAGGSDHNNLGDLDAAEEFYVKAIELFHESARQGDQSRELKQLLTDDYLALVNVYHEKQDSDKANKYFQLAKEQIATLKQDDWRTALLQIQIYEHDAEAAALDNDHESALGWIDKSEELLPLLKGDEAAVELENQKIWIATNRGLSHQAMGELDIARDEFAKAVELAKDSHDREPLNARAARRYSSTLVQLGDVEFSLEHPEDALQLYQTGLDIVSALADKDPDSIELVANKAQKLSRISSVHSYTGDLENSLKAILEAVEIHEGLESRGLSTLSTRRDNALSVLAAAGVYGQMQNTEMGMKLLDQHQKLCERLLELDDDSAFEWNQLAENHFYRAVQLVGIWANAESATDDPRKSPDYLAIINELNHSLRYFKMIEDQQGLTFNQEGFREQVQSVKKIVEDSVQQIPSADADSSI
ncbi:MAG: serine/threonine-protein kinase [Pirellulaceae bacterium]